MSPPYLIQMEFLNKEWDNPLREIRLDGEVIIHKELPMEMKELKLSDVPYLCRIVTHSNVTRKQGAQLCFPHLDGSVSIYASRKCLGSADGLWSFLLDRRASPVDADRVLAAWNWLIQNNPLYQEFRRIPVEVWRGLIEEQSRTLAVGSGSAQQREIFSATVLRALPPGPRMAEQEVGEMIVGLDVETLDTVKFSNRDILHMIFPELYPFARGGFRLEHHKTKLRSEDSELDESDVYTIKEYAKYRLMHFDRRFSRNARFISFMSDWVLKNATSGYQMRTTTKRRGGGQATKKSDIMDGKKKIL